MTSKEKAARIAELKKEIARLRNVIWAEQSEEDKKNGTGWVCLRYDLMTRVDELQDIIDDLRK